MKATRIHVRTSGQGGQLLGSNAIRAVGLRSGVGGTLRAELSVLPAACELLCMIIIRARGPDAKGR